jgi:hypothetical protein
MNKKNRKRIAAQGRLLAVVGHRNRDAILEQTKRMSPQEIDEVRVHLETAGGEGLAIRLAKRDKEFLVLPADPDHNQPRSMSLTREGGLRWGNMRIKGWKLWCWVRCTAPLHRVTWHEWQGVRFRMGWRDAWAALRGTGWRAFR